MTLTRTRRVQRQIVQTRQVLERGGRSSMEQDARTINEKAECEDDFAFGG